MQKEKKIKVIFDTNIWVSFFLDGRNRIFQEIILDTRVEIYASDELADELFETLKNKKFAKYFDKSRLSHLQILFFESVILTIPKSQVQICRDPKDDFLLALAKDIKADYLITGDKDLLEHDNFYNIRIVKPSFFHKILNPVEL